MWGSSKAAIGFHLDPQDKGNWTVCTYLGHLLNEAEKEFGRRDTSWTLVGVEFQVGQPWLRLLVNKQVVIVLSDSCLNDKDRTIFQLAHEVVHLLDPGFPISVLEEGVATRFMTAKSQVQNHDPAYEYCAKLVQELEDICPNAPAQIRSLSASHKDSHEQYEYTYGTPLSLVKSETICDLLSKTAGSQKSEHKELADKLVEKFDLIRQRYPAPTT